MPWLRPFTRPLAEGLCLVRNLRDTSAMQSEPSMRRNMTQSHGSRGLSALAALLALGCASPVVPVGQAAGHSASAANAGSPAQAAGAAAATPAMSANCTWPASLDDPNAARGACRAARALVSCSTPGRATETCLSDDPTRCPMGPQPASACHDSCKPDEYAVTCGAVGPSVGDATPPASCHDPMQTPGGPAFYCCTCDD
jgi:hypothetical protein